MKLETVAKCAIRACPDAASIGNLCERRQLPETVLEVRGARSKRANRTYIITSWYTEHEGTRGIVVLNDLVLGELFEATFAANYAGGLLRNKAYALKSSTIIRALDNRGDYA